MDKMLINQRYDYLTPRDRALGIHLCGVGTRLIPPHAPYQIYEDGAPYQWKNGRVIRDFSLVYLSRGGGMFRVRGSQPIQVSAGDIMLIHPGVWHDYAPAPETGWKEYWIMFNGRQAEELISMAELPRRAPVMRHGVDEALHHVFTQMLEVAAGMPPFASVIHAGLVLQLVALIQSRLQLQREQGDREESFIQRAKHYMADIVEQRVDMVTLARSLGVSYPHFRRVFKTSTGLPPRQYLLNLRVNRAKQLMEEPGIKLSEVARRAGFDDPYYFSRVFKKKTGISPSEWRR